MRRASRALDSLSRLCLRLVDPCRPDGAIAAWQELNRRVAEDLHAGTGFIAPPVIKWATPDPRRLSLTVHKPRLLIREDAWRRE